MEKEEEISALLEEDSRIKVIFKIFSVTESIIKLLLFLTCIKKLFDIVAATNWSKTITQS